jgi:predicted dehydrogenase
MHPITNAKTRKLRFGLIGAGRIADSYVQAFRSASNATLVAVADVRPETAKALAEAAGCQAFTSHRQMLEQIECDAVVVATPPSTHPDICLDAIRRKLHVLCEKPVCLTVEAAIGLRDAARQEAVLFTMASKFRYADDVIRAKSLVTSGVLGEIVLFENTFMARVDMSARWNSQPAIAGGGVLIDNGTHSVDIMRYFLGPLEEIYAAECRRTQGLKVEETVRVQVKSNNGVFGSMDLSWSLNKEVDHYIVIYGSHGTLRVGWKQSTYRQASAADWVTFGNGYNKVSAFRRQIENFSGAIQGEEQLRITADDAIASVEAIQAAYQALEKGTWIPLSQQQPALAAAS